MKWIIVIICAPAILLFATALSAIVILLIAEMLCIPPYVLSVLFEVVLSSKHTDKKS